MHICIHDYIIQIAKSTFTFQHFFFYFLSFCSAMLLY